METTDSRQVLEDATDPTASFPAQETGNAREVNAPSLTPPKPIHTLVLDTGPLIKNDPPVSTLLAQAEELYTLPSVVDEIRDPTTRARVQTTLLPFLMLRSPKPQSLKFVTDFARRMGDLEVLSRPDIHLIALTYELECERNGGDWRLRNTPGQKGLNGKSPAQVRREQEEGAARDEGEAAGGREASSAGDQSQGQNAQKPLEDGTSESLIPANTTTLGQDIIPEEREVPTIAQETITQELDSLNLNQSAPLTEDYAPDAAAVISEETKASDEKVEEPQPIEAPQEEHDDDDEGGWITPSNLKQHQEKDRLASTPGQPIQKVLQAALLTSDFAMQNVTLRMNLNLVSPALSRITRVKTWVQRCHGCFQLTRDMTRQFCPRCGQPTLTRVSCSTDQGGNFTVHLKKNFQWNKRGNVYSVPKPVHGTPNGKLRGAGGGKNGWGRELILAEDQPEYTKRSTDEKRARTRDLMDEDYLPSILSGDRSKQASGRIRIGAGRNVNSKKR